MNFITALVFALVFHAIWSLRDCAHASGQTRTVHALIALTFLVLAWGLGRLA